MGLCYCHDMWKQIQNLYLAKFCVNKSFRQLTSVFLWRWDLKKKKNYFGHWYVDIGYEDNDFNLSMKERQHKFGLPWARNQPHLIYWKGGFIGQYDQYMQDNLTSSTHHLKYEILSRTWTPCVYPSTRRSGSELPLASKEFSVYNDGSLMSACSNLMLCNIRKNVQALVLYCILSSK